MIVAIPSITDNIDSLIDERFARCRFFCFYDIEKRDYSFKENNNRNGSGGVGPRVVEFLAENGIGEVYAREVGPKAQKTLDIMKIETKIADRRQTVRQIIDKITKR